MKNRENQYLLYINQNKRVIYSKIQALTFLLTGIALSYTILQAEPLKPEFILHTPIILKLFFVLLCGLVLVFVVFSPKNLLNKLYYNGFFLSLLGFGFIFIYGLTNFVGQFVVTTTGGIVDFIREIIKIAGIAALVGGIVKFMKERNRVEKEEALKYNSGLVTSLVDSIPDLVFYKDLDGIYLGCNAEFALHVGYEKEDIVGKTDYDLYSKEEADGFRKNDRHMLELGTKRHNEEWISYPDGRKVLLDTLKTPYYNADGKQIGILGICRDITGRKQAGEALAFQLELEKVISQISSTFINLPAEQIGKGINYALQLTGELFDVDRSYVFLFSPDGKKMSNTHEWCNQGVEPQIRILQNLQVNTFPWWLKKLERLETIAIPNVDELPPEAAAEKDILQTQFIQSVLVVPMAWGNKLCGFMGFDTIRQKKVWIDEQISLLRVVSELISTALLKREADEALRESEEKYRALAESIPDIIMRFDHKGRHLLVSKSVLQVVNINPSQFIGKTHRELGFAEDMCALWEDAIDAVFKQGQLLETEFEFEGINGPVIFNWRLVPEFDRSGNVKTVLSISRDITGRKQAEEALRRREQEFRALAENAPDIVARFDRNLRYLYVNPAVVKHTGIPREKFIGGTSEELNMPVEQTRLRNSILMDVFQSGEEKDMYYEHVTPSGRKYYHSRIAPEFGADGTVETVLSIARDISAVKEMEAALQQEMSRSRRRHLRSLSDILPQIPGLVLAARYRPAPKLQGDYYNVIRRGNQMLIYLIDIHEKSDDGVMQSFFVRKHMEDYLNYQDDHDILTPTLLLHHLAKQYTQDNQTEACPLCIFIAVFDMGDAGELRYASSGSCTPPLLISGDEMLELPVDKPCLATGNEADTPPAFQEHSLAFVPGTTFIFSTNGLFRQGNEQGSYEQRFREVFRRHYHLPPELISRAIAVDFADFSNKSPLEEDIAYLIVQVPEKEQKLSFKVESDFNHISKAKAKVASFLEAHLELKIDLLNFHELLINAIEHGNKRDGGKKVSVDITITDRYWKIIITDQGEGFNWRDRINRELDLSGDSDRGRGIIMTKMMSDYLGYNKRGNKVTMINLR